VAAAVRPAHWRPWRRQGGVFDQVSAGARWARPLEAARNCGLAHAVAQVFAADLRAVAEDQRFAAGAFADEIGIRVSASSLDVALGTARASPCRAAAGAM